MNFLSGQTLMPLGLAVVTIGGGAAWATNVHVQISNQEKEITRLRKAVVLMLKSQSRIEGRLGIPKDESVKSDWESLLEVSDE